MTVYFSCNSIKDIKECAQLIDRGHIIIFPTDTVYGIGCDPLNDKSIVKLYEIKKRPFEKYLPILTCDIDQILKLVVVNEHAKVLMNYFWPGQLTLILKLRERHSISKYVFNNDEGTIALRIPNNICTLRLINLTKNKLLVGTSANLSKQKPLRSVTDIQNNALTGYDAVLDGGSLNESGGNVSTIVDVSAPDKFTIIREGLISKERVIDVLKIYGYNK